MNILLKPDSTYILIVSDKYMELKYLKCNQ